MLKNEIIQIVESLLEINTVSTDKTLAELEIDSIIFIRLVVECEQRFHIVFEDEMLLITKFPDLKSFIEYVQTRAGDGIE